MSEQEKEFTDSVERAVRTQELLVGEVTKLRTSNRWLGWIVAVLILAGIGSGWATIIAYGAAEQAQETANANRQIALQADYDRCTSSNNARLRTRETRQSEMLVLQDELNDREDGPVFEAAAIPGYVNGTPPLRQFIEFLVVFTNEERAVDIDFLRSEINRLSQEYVSTVVRVPLIECGPDPSLAG